MQYNDYNQNEIVTDIITNLGTTISKFKILGYCDFWKITLISQHNEYECSISM